MIQSHHSINRCLAAAVSAALLVAGGEAAALDVGTAAAVNTVTNSAKPGEAAQTLMVGNRIVFNETIITEANGKAQLLFIDESTLTIGPDSEVVIDRFVYDPETKTGEMAVTLGKGLLRFVGGRISKQEGGVTFNTPVATIRIRGGIGIVSHDPTAGSGGQSGLIFLFGKEGTISNDQGTVRLFRPGWSASAQSGAAPADTGPASGDDISGALGSMEGNSEGGESSVNDDQVADSGIDNSNSGSDPGSTGDSGNNQGTGGTAGGNTQSDTADDARTNSVQDTASDQLEPEPDEPSARFLATPDVPYNTDDGLAFDDPAAQNALGGPDPQVDRNVYNRGEFDYTITLDDTTGVGSLFATVAPQIFADPETAPETPTTLAIGDGTTLDLPIRTGTFTIGSVAEGADFASSDTVTPFGTVTGNGFLSADQRFFFYELTEDDAPGFREFIAGGILTPDSAFNATGLRLDRYGLRRDAAFDAAIPMVTAAIDVNFATPAVSDLLILRQADGVLGDCLVACESKVLQASLAIEGSGADQKSLLLGTSGSLFQETAFDGQLREDAVTIIGQAAIGSLRLAAGEGAVQLVADVTQMPGGELDTFWGQDLDHFVLTTDGPGLDSSAGDVDFGAAVADPLDPGGDDEIWSYRHVASRLGEQLLGERTTRSDAAGTAAPLNGYTAGVSRRWTASGGLEDPSTFDNANDLPSDVTISTFAGDNSVAVDFRLDGATLFFAGQGEFRGAFLDDQRFAARNSATRAGSVDGQTGQFRTFLVTQDLVPEVSIDGVEFCTCDYLT